MDASVEFVAPRKCCRCAHAQVRRATSRFLAEHGLTSASTPAPHPGSIEDVIVLLNPAGEGPAGQAICRICRRAQCKDLTSLASNDFKFSHTRGVQTNILLRR